MYIHRIALVFVAWGFSFLLHLNLGGLVKCGVPVSKIYVRHVIHTQTLLAGITNLSNLKNFGLLLQCIRPAMQSPHFVIAPYTMFYSNMISTDTAGLITGHALCLL